MIWGYQYFWKHPYVEPTLRQVHLGQNKSHAPKKTWLRGTQRRLEEWHLAKFLWPNECRTISGQARSRLLSHPIQMVVAEKKLIKDVRDSFRVCNSKLHPSPQSYPLVIPCQIGTCCTNGCKQKRSREMRKDSSGR